MDRVGLHKVDELFPLEYWTYIVKCCQATSDKGLKVRM
jgi:hypothetical protein